MTVLGPLPSPIDQRVDRWGGGLPQYIVGHRSLVARVRSAVATQPGLAVCGAAYDGVGIPACVASGVAAAEQVLAGLASFARLPGENEAMADVREGAERPRDQRHHPVHHVVGVPRRAPAWATATGRRWPPRSPGLFEQLAAKDVVVRGDVRRRRAARGRRRHGLVARADVDDLQEAYSLFRRTELGRARSTRCGRSWRCTGRRSSTRVTCPRSWRTRRRGRTCASIRSSGPTSGTCCPTRNAARCSSSTGSRRGRYPDVRANTVASFALGDYEWILAFEADELHRIVDLMRDLRASRCAAARTRGGALLHRPPPLRGRPRRHPPLSPDLWRDTGRSEAL